MFFRNLQKYHTIQRAYYGVSFFSAILLSSCVGPWRTLLANLIIHQEEPRRLSYADYCSKIWLIVLSVQYFYAVWFFLQVKCFTDYSGKLISFPVYMVTKITRTTKNYNFMCMTNKWLYYEVRILKIEMTEELALSTEDRSWSTNSSRFL